MRVLLTEDQTKKMCAALKRLLAQESELNVVGEAAEATDLLIQVQKTRPDLVLLDWELPGLESIDLLSALHDLDSPPKVVAFSESRDMCHAALAAGVDAFVCREEPQEQMLTTLRSVGGLSPLLPG